MSGSANPLTCCDRECAGANGCEVGGIECERCHRYFCADEICENGMCDECAEEYEREQEAEDGE